VCSLVHPIGAYPHHVAIHMMWYLSKEAITYFYKFTVLTFIRPSCTSSQLEAPVGCEWREVENVR